MIIFLPPLSHVTWMVNNLYEFDSDVMSRASVRICALVIYTTNTNTNTNMNTKYTGMGPPWGEAGAKGEVRRQARKIGRQKLGSAGRGRGTQDLRSGRRVPRSGGQGGIL